MSDTPREHPTDHADIGVFGGSGFYSFLDDVTEVEVDTPYGRPSAPLHLGSVGERRIAFLARHGTNHQFPPHRINYRANLWAMRHLGVKRIFAPCASGSLQPHIHPGEFVVPDQFVDRTSGRADTFFEGPTANHVSMADPYCPELSAVALRAGRDQGITMHEGGTVVVIQGPRFSTRSESRWFRQAGWEVINMTQYPEAALARELGLCYTSVALITDYDTGVEGEDGVEPVTQEEIFAFFDANLEKVRGLLFDAIGRVPDEIGCRCSEGPNGIDPEPPPAPEP
ncbi:MAG: S-methyl-5'-thioadenosine phosphorylase [Acidimicrobiales bacterium]|nr:S-methyl-5'-thioadenosine phosphorylase [Acidimicrobiales bacterium]MCB9372248.1 S-methyl-5'-thioadenosine phosphorylase [Microthrixaceae bacterium]